MSNKCPQDKISKKYIIPTDKWLEPLQLFITDDISTKGLLMLAKYMETKDVVVKITKGLNSIKQNRLKFASKKLTGLPNFVATFCSFSCVESSINMETNYTEVKEFCKPNQLDPASNEEVFIEIMPKYTQSLINHLNKLRKERVENIAKQLILAQLNAFNLYGFMHMDIHLGNILCGPSLTEPKEIIYTFPSNTYYNKTHIYKIIVDREVFITDFDKSIFINPDLEKFKFESTHLLIYNLIRTLNKCAELIAKQDEKIKFKQIIANQQNQENNYIHFEEKDLSAYSKGYKELELYKKDVLNCSFSYLNKVWLDYFGNYLFNDFTFV